MIFGSELKKKFIIIDGIFYGTLSGGGKHLHNLLSEWVKNNSTQVNLILFINKKHFGYYQEFEKSVRIYPIPFIQMSPLLGIIFSVTILPIICRVKNVDRLFLPFNSYIPTKKWFGVQTISVIRDLAEYHIPNKYDLFRMYYRKKLMMPSAARNPDKVVFISQSAYIDAEEHIGRITSKHKIIYHGRSLEFKKSSNSNEIREFGIDPNGYILSVGRLDPIGKNYIRLIEAFELFVEDIDDKYIKLVIAGEYWRNSKQIINKINSMKYKKNVILTDYINKTRLIELYSYAMFFIFPTIYEGFGHPIIESMSCDCPVTCSNVSSLPEIGGTSCHYFDPYDINSIKNALNCMYKNPELRKKLRLAGRENIKRFSWQDTAQQTLKFILEE